MEKLKRPLVGELSLYLDDVNLRTNSFEEGENDVNSKRTSSNQPIILLWGLNGQVTSMGHKAYLDSKEWRRDG